MRGEWRIVISFCRCRIWGEVWCLRWPWLHLDVFEAFCISQVPYSHGAPSLEIFSHPLPSLKSILTWHLDQKESLPRKRGQCQGKGSKRLTEGAGIVREVLDSL
jgi:hypothetical protein